MGSQAIRGLSLADGAASVDAFVMSGGVTRRATISAVMAGALAAANSAAARSILEAVGHNELDASFATATGSGSSADASAALAALDAAGSDMIHIPKGVTRIASSMTIDTPLAFPTNGMIRPAAGVVVTLAGKPSSPPLRQIFDHSEGGSVVFAPGVQDVAWPEWWDGTGRSSCLAALKAAESSGAAEVVLQKVDYYLGAPCWNILTSHLKVRGGAKQWRGAKTATRIIASGGTGTVVQVGPDTMPTGGFANFQTHNEIEDIGFGRDNASAIPAPGSEQNASCGLKFSFCLWGAARRCSSDENILGFVARGTVQQHFEDCETVRSLAGTGAAGPDIYWGFFADETVDIGAAGGNASLYIINGNVGCATIFESVAIKLKGACADTFVDRLETTGVKTPIDIFGTKGLGLPPGSNTDINITNVVCDGYTYRGVSVQNVEAHSSITITGGDLAPAGGVGDCAAYFHNNDGPIVFKNNKLQCFPAPGNYGIYSDTNQSLFTEDNMIVGSSKPERWENCTGGTSENIIKNPSEVGTEAAILVTNCQRMLIHPKQVSGPAGFDQGICLSDAASRYNTIDPSGIDPASVATGAAYKVAINGASVLSEGTVQNNRIIGLMN